MSPPRRRWARGVAAQRPNQTIVTSAGSINAPRLLQHVPLLTVGQ